MAVLNPFFRQSVQNPGMDISTRGAGPSVDTSGQLDLELQMIDNQTKAFNSAMEMVAVYAKAEAQIKEEEDNNILKKVANDLSQDAMTMVNGYKNQTDFKIGDYSISKGEKGFHAYTDLEDQFKGIKSDVLERMLKTYNPEGDTKLNEMIELAVDGAFIAPMAQSDEYVRNHIHQRSLADLKNKAFESLEALDFENFDSVLTYDKNVEAKIASGALDPVNAEKEKVEFRKEGFKKLILNKLPLNATLEEKRNYINWYNRIIKYKTGKLESKEKDTFSDSEKAFYDKLTILDLRSLNRGLGSTAFSVPKEDQLSSLKLQAMENPIETANEFGYKFEVVADKKGKPSYVRMIPKSSERVEHTFSSEEGWLKGFIKKYGNELEGSTEEEKIKNLIGLQESDEVRKKLSKYSENKAVWGKNDKFIYFKSDDKKTRIQKIEETLKNKQLGNLSHSDVLSVLQNAKAEALKRAKSSYGQGLFKENRTQIAQDVSKYINEWDSIFTNRDTFPNVDFAYPHVAVSVPVALNKRTSSNAGQDVWTSIDPQIQGINTTITQVHDVMGRSYLVSKLIQEGRINIDDLDSTIEDIKLDLAIIKADELGGLFIGQKFENMLERVLFKPYNNFKTVWKNTTNSSGRSRLDWCANRVESNWSSEDTSKINKDALVHIIGNEARKCSMLEGIRPFKEAMKNE